MTGIGKAMMGVIRFVRLNSAGTGSCSRLRESSVMMEMILMEMVVMQTASLKWMMCSAGMGGVNPANNEECDDGNHISGDRCSATCQEEFCGDGIAMSTLVPPEQCDDG